MIEVADPPTPGAGEVWIELRAAGVGNWDEIVRTGGWDVGRNPPMALGVEAAGVIAAVGPGVGDWSVGEEVLTHPLPFADQGTWAPSLIVRAELLARKPAEISWAHAAAFPVPALTAVQVVDDFLRVKSGETLLVNGAGGVTGGLIVAVGVLRGAEVSRPLVLPAASTCSALVPPRSSTTTSRTGRARSSTRRAGAGSMPPPMRPGVAQSAL